MRRDAKATSDLHGSFGRDNHDRSCYFWFVSKGESTREAIVREAFMQATRVGLEGLSLGVLAETLGLSKSGLFAHFKAKEALQRAVLEHAIDLFAQQVVVPALAKPRGRPRLTALFANLLAWKDGDSTRRGCLFAQLSVEYDDRPGPIRDLFVESELEWRRTIEMCVQKAIAEGHIRAEVAPAQFAFEMIGIAAAYEQSHRLLGMANARDLAEHAFEQLLDSNAPRARRK